MRTIRSAVPKALAMVGKTTRCSRKILGAGRVEERIHVGISRPQRVFDVVARDRVAADRLADEVVEGTRASIRRAIAVWSAVPRSA